MSLLMQNSRDLHRVPCSPFIGPPYSCQTPAQFVPEVEFFNENDQATSVYDESEMHSAQLRRTSVLQQTRRTHILANWMNESPSTPIAVAPVPSNTPRQKFISYTPSAEQLVPFCSPYVSPLSEPSIQRRYQDNTEDCNGIQKKNSSKRKIRSPPQEACGIDSIDLFSGDDDIFA